MSKFASEQDIKKAYKRLSKKYHPDKNTEEGAEDKFVEVAHGEFSSSDTFTIVEWSHVLAAYEVLSDSTVSLQPDYLMIPIDLPTVETWNIR